MRPKWILLSLLLVTIAAGVTAQSRLAPPTTRTPTCADADCHADVVDHPFLHGPVAAGACEVCHTYEDPAAHRFTFKSTGADMCDFCHIGKTDPEGRKLHEPVAKGECLACHDPHGSVHRMMIKGETEGALCLQCHESVTNRTHVHSPIEDGSCSTCHRSHHSQYDKLLVAEGRALCLQCHEDVQHPVTAAPLPAIYSPDHENKSLLAHPVHQPVLDDECSSCHFPHSSDHKGLLRDQLKTLCTSCHGVIHDTSTAAAVPHLMVDDEEACLHCHLPHQSRVPHLLKDWPSVLCLECHSEPVARSDGTLIQAALDLVHPGEFAHGPVANQDCQACHDIHGAKHKGLLTESLAGSFYQEYDPTAYQFCLRCHDRNLVEAPNSNVTGFRNGDVNLHYTHVVEPKNGRNCRVCHSTHTSSSARLLKSEIEFGNWKIPVGFQQTDNGGSCAAGCHRARSYDRVVPVNQDASEKAPSAAPTERAPEDENDPTAPGGAKITAPEWDQALSTPESPGR